jgi:hypothetical protein
MRPAATAQVAFHAFVTVPEIGRITFQTSGALAVLVTVTRVQ